MRRLLSVLIVVPLAGVILALAIANRAPTRLSLDPFNPADPVLSTTLPLFVYLLLAVILGLILGGVSTWLSQRQHRKDARRLRRETVRIKGDLARAELARARYADARPVEGRSVDGGRGAVLSSSLALTSRH